MSIDSMPATKAQIGYIKGLRRKIGINGQFDRKIDSQEASSLISDLVSALNTGQKIDESRLGMAITECFRIWKNNGWDIYKKHRKEFITEAVDTYWLFAEIAKKLESDVK